MPETATPPAAGASPPCDAYHTALVRALMFQVSFVFLASLMLDGFIFRAKFCAVSVGYWSSVIAILIFRPGGWGLRYLRHGVLATFALVVIADLIWHETFSELLVGD